MAGGCTAIQDATTRLPGPRLYEKGAAVIGSIREFEQRIGFRPTENFIDLDKETESYPFCGMTPQLHLPYSYEDPSIRWAGGIDNETDCRNIAGPARDAYFGQTEAMGEQGTPVTPSMLAGTLVRFVYLVIHEDCHDQYDFPLGFEEALCNLITYHGMVAYAGEGGRSTLERVAMRRYAERESEKARDAINFYGQLERLYARHQRKEIPVEEALAERARIFEKAERALDWRRGSLTNVGMANDMTYSRHYPFVERVFDALGRDLARTVEFFRKVDSQKPSRAAVLKQLKLKTERDIDFIRTYEEAVLDTVRRTLAAEGLTLKQGAPGR